jgi:3-keto-5-aminohexanoate cleavage enzyme
VRLDRDTLAPSNAALVRQVVDLCAEYGRRPASVSEARKILDLAAYTALNTTAH